MVYNDWVMIGIALGKSFIPIYLHNPIPINYIHHQSLLLIITKLLLYSKQILYKIFKAEITVKDVIAAGLDMFGLIPEMISQQIQLSLETKSQLRNYKIFMYIMMTHNLMKYERTKINLTNFEDMISQRRILLAPNIGQSLDLNQIKYIWSNISGPLVILRRHYNFSQEARVNTWLNITLRSFPGEDCRSLIKYVRDSTNKRDPDTFSDQQIKLINNLIISLRKN